MIEGEVHVAQHVRDDDPVVVVIVYESKHALYDLRHTDMLIASSRYATLVANTIILTCKTIILNRCQYTSTCIDGAYN